MLPNSHTAKHAFFYLLAFFALGFTAVALGQILFQIINHIFPETTTSYSGTFHQSILRFGISALIVAGPVYFFVTRQINRELEKGEMERNAAVRRWLTYFLLFIAGTVVIGDLIAVIDNFFEGELTVKFFLKAFTILAIAGGFGSYYFLDLKRENLQRDLKLKIFGAIFIAVVVAALTISFMLIDSPQKARELREDSERVSELQQISYAITESYRQNSALPQNLDTLVTDSKIREEVLRDPVSDEKYQFELVDTTNYKLCATFTHATVKEDYFDPAWQHDVGRACFALTIYQNENYPTVDVIPIR